MNKIKVSFLDRAFIDSNRSGDGIKGYEPARISTPDGEVRVGRVINLKRLGDCGQIETLWFQASFPLTCSEIDLKPVLEADKDGKKWLENWHNYFQEFHGEQIPTTISIDSLELPSGVRYSLMPRDYIERTKDGRRYKCPEGKLIEVPKTAFYWHILPPLKYKDGKWLRHGVNYSRRVSGANGVFDLYTLHDPTEEHYCLPGSLLGALNEDDLKEKQGDFERCFPLEHSLEAHYLSTLRLAHKIPPLTIRVELEK